MTTYTFTCETVIPKYAKERIKINAEDFFTACDKAEKEFAQKHNTKRAYVRITNATIH